MLVFDCASVSVSSELNYVFFDCSFLGQGSELGNGSASCVHRSERLLKFFFEVFPSPKAWRVLGEGLFIVVCSPGLSYGFLHMREAKGDSLLISIVDIAVDEQVCFDQH